MASGLSSFTRKRNDSASLVHRSQRNALLGRSIFLMLLVTLAMGSFAYRLVQLQIVHGVENRQLAEANRVRLLPIPSDRGEITDRDGKRLAANRLTRSVYLWPRQQNRAQWQTTAEKLSPLLNVPAAEIIAKLEKAGYGSPLPVRISQQLSPTAFVALAEQSEQFAGVEVMAESSRYYPNGSLGAHVLGYIGEATADDIQENPHYPNGIIVGQMGIERLANRSLLGTWGNRRVEVNARGQELRWLGTQPAISGESLRMTLDLDLQQTAERALGQRRGAVVVLNVKTGEVLAMASGPSFDPNLFTRRITEAEWQRLQDPTGPLLNRALQGYPPGSTFKIVTSAAAMQSGDYSPSSRVGTAACINVGGTNFCEHGSSGYGAIGFQKALTVSSNTFFYRVGMTTGPEEIAKWGQALGLGTSSDMGLEGATHSYIPVPEEKEELFGEPWYTGDTVSMSIGQGLVQATPLELAVMTATIANGGKRVVPHLLMSETNTPETAPKPTGIRADIIETIQAGLRDVVRSGTARSLNDGSIPLTAGKTGTAEVTGKSNSMYVGYGPYENPEIAIAVVVENGGYGAVAAVPIAHEVYKTYFGRPSAPQRP
ncbi:penicillin-binding protein 2 [Microcoleus sp. FACHB-1515]|uniref:penicillin-binding protein 2 n=1 Tax=Cyanophyceae TaxID=3028117 RepID=UPI0016822B10|nr:penicillin-binding protein 2 [Microcoleus sp. FACHB-1515]MBD2089147.1 penicillin-binding protein 2 [Microcoleus sp. FACHB-1515]